MGRPFIYKLNEYNMNEKETYANKINELPSNALVVTKKKINSVFAILLIAMGVTWTAYTANMDKFNEIVEIVMSFDFE